MTDPLSVTASVVGITSFGITLCRTVLNFYFSVKDSRRDVRDLCESIERLQRTLNEVERIIRRSNHHRVAATVFDNIQSCKVGLDRLAHKMEKSRKAMADSTVLRLPAQLQYPFRESTITRLREIVSPELIGHLSLSLSVLKLYVNVCFYLDFMTHTSLVMSQKPISKACRRVYLTYMQTSAPCGMKRSLL